MKNPHCPVLIVGAGPVGMTLALTLAHLDVPSIIVECNQHTTRHPKMDLTNGRSMEIFRSLGLADSLRAVGVPADLPLDVIWATSPLGHLLHRFAYPSPDAAREIARLRNDGTATCEPCMRVSQVILEPVLKAQLDYCPLIDVRFGHAFQSFAQDETGVTATVSIADTGHTQEIRCEYLVGCDGGGSRVRELAGIGLEGQFGIAEFYMIHFRCAQSEVFNRFGPVYHLQTGHGTLISQDGADIWTLHVLAPPDSRPEALLRDFVGGEIAAEILVANPWKPHMSVADHFRAGRVFLAGDAVHQVIPTGGYGMNTGVGDAADLGWKLAGAISGWAGDGLLESYELERRPVALRNREAAARHLVVRQQITERILAAEAEGDLDKPEAAYRRIALGREIGALGNMENESWGIEHGFSYCGSPHVLNDVEMPPFAPERCQPSTVPGSRFPNYYLDSGQPVSASFGRGFSLVAIGTVDIGDIETVAAERGLPLTIARLDIEAVTERLGARLILVRPDHHIAWRGDRKPASWHDLIALVVGLSSRRALAEKVT